jgi:hypothetical protein
MFKKFVSITTAVLLMASGVLFSGAIPAHATAPVVASTSTLTVGQVNPTIQITSTSTFSSSPTLSNFAIGWTVSSTGLAASAVSLSGNTITLSLSGTTGNGTLTVTISAGAFSPSASGANVLSFQAQSIPATIGAFTISGGSAPTANGTSPNGIGGSMGQWSVNSLFTWSPALTNGRFAAGTVYTGTIDVVPTNGYNFEGLSSSFFTHSGATSVSTTYIGSPRTRATITIVFPATAGGSTPSSSSSSSSGESTSAVGFAQAQAAQHIQLVRVERARTTLFVGLTATKPGTLADYANAELEVKSEAALARVNAKVLALPVAQRSNTDEIAKIIKLENFVDSISTSEVHSGTIALQLVRNGFISADNRFKLSLANALRTRPASSVDSVEEIKLAIVQETARLQERVKRTAEIRAKIAARIL